ncbi:TIGR03364 family FAD-dependent oxidoreductase [Tundrisphaera lichenicola]|uniref:TIGR03364 family FAD-dependent oxidoreductase n=1 Tax=Tundrisphaera lichenicola TaxID=2029860 RepID=UPI003EBB88C4
MMTRADARGPFDDAVVGSGIIGLAVARQLALRGRRVIVFERHPRAMGASVRNFGTLWPIGQPAGATRRLALRSLETWRALLPQAGLWHAPLGSLHLAYHQDEEQVLREFVDRSGEQGIDCELVGPTRASDLSPSVRREGLRAGLFSPTEICVDPREVLARLPGFLGETLGVQFAFGKTVTHFEAPDVRAGGEDWRADRLWVCSGDEFELLYPEAFREQGLARCKLQMLRSEPMGTDSRLGPILAGGLTLRHYRSFETCPTLPALRARIAAEHPEFDRFGIHVMASQNGRGEVVIGDSHEYDDAIEPFDKVEIDELILNYLGTFLDCPGLRIASRWHGIYPKHPTEPFVVFQPGPGVTAVEATNGIGMTLSFGLAEQVVDQQLGKE